jgi:hypothetical protein
MNHNPYNFKVGDKVILDKDYQCGGGEFYIHSFTPNEMFATISFENDITQAWQVMTNRLTPIKQ